MRHSLVLVAIASLIAVHPGASAAGPVHLGVTGGLNLANLSFDDSDENLSDSRKGIVAGAFVSFPVSPAFSITPAVLLRSSGDKEELTESGVTVAITGKLTYLEVPVMARVHLPSGSVRPWFGAGPSVAFNISSKIEAEASGGDVSGSAEVEIDEIVKPVDFGVAFGGGLDFGIGSGGQTVGVEVRYTLGLSDVIEGEFDLESGTTSSSETSDGKNRSLSFLVNVGLI